MTSERCPTHPGKMLRLDILPNIRMSIKDIARCLGVSRQALHAVLNEKSAVSPSMALRLGKFLNTGPGIWLTMQHAFDLWQTRREIKGILKGIQTVAYTAPRGRR